MPVGKAKPINTQCEVFSVLACLVKRKGGRISLLTQLLAQVQTKLVCLLQRQQPLDTDLSLNQPWGKEAAIEGILKFNTTPRLNLSQGHHFGGC